MFHHETGMFPLRIALPGIAVLMIAVALLVPRSMLAQRGGGGGGNGGGGRNTTPIICVHDCPSLREGLNADDDLKSFRRSIAMQATADQRAAFARISQYTQAACDQLKDFQESLQRVSTPVSLADHSLADRSFGDRRAALDQAVEQARAGNQNLLGSLSDAQKSGLKEITAKLAKADSELDKQIKMLDQIVQVSKPDTAQFNNPAASLSKALASFQSEQLALGGEMSIVFPAPGQDVIFSLPLVTNSIRISGQPLSIRASGAVLSRPAAEAGHNLFHLKLVADLSDVQQNITAILRPEITRSPRCGERIELRQATLTPIAPASLVVADLHFERWVCLPGQSPADVADADGTLEIRLTPSIEPKTSVEPNIGSPNSGLALASEITHVQAEGFLRDMLRSGDLGVTLRDQIAAVLLSAMRPGADLKSTLPPAAQDAATLLKVQFQDAGVEQLTLVLDGQLQLSAEQTKLLATQLKQRLTAQGDSPP